jgi:hypothetical protein
MDNQKQNPNSETSVMVSSHEDRLTTLDLFDPIRTKSALMVASQIAASSMIPEAYRSRPENVLVAMMRSARLGVDPFAYMEASYVIKGKVGHEAKFMIALLNTCGKFKGPIRYEFEGEIVTEKVTVTVYRDNKPVQVTKTKVSPLSTRKCTAWAILKDSGEKVGQTVEISMAFAEGWMDKDKWNTMPDVMLQYRAASFFGSLYAPEVKMGLVTTDELEDMPDAQIIDENAGRDIFEKGDDVSTEPDPVLDPTKEIKQPVTVVESQPIVTPQPVEVKTQPVPTSAINQSSGPIDFGTPPTDVPAFREYLLKLFKNESSTIDAFLVFKKWLPTGGTLPDLTDAQLKNFLSKWDIFTKLYNEFKASRNA